MGFERDGDGIQGTQVDDYAIGTKGGDRRCEAVATAASEEGGLG